MNRMTGHEGISLMPCVNHPFGRYLSADHAGGSLGSIECSVENGRGSHRTMTRVVRLTLVDEVDGVVLSERGLTFLRRLRIFRITNEADRQGCRLSYRDLHDLLLASFSTLKRDIAALRREGLRIPLSRQSKKADDRPMSEFEPGEDE